MNIPAVVDVCISLAFLYLILSLMCTTVNEIIATYMKYRSKDLSKAIISLIDDPEILTRFYQNGLIKNAINAANGGVAPPTMKISMPLPKGAAGTIVATRCDRSSEVPLPGKHSSYLDSRSFAMALLGSLEEGKPVPLIEDMNTTIAKLPDGSIKDVVGAAVASAGDDINAIRDNIAQSFDTVMDRLSGEYQRRLRIISLCVGIGIAVFLNADSFAVSQAIWRDSALGSQTVAAAEQFTQVQFDQLAKNCTLPDPGQGAANTGDTVETNADCLGKLRSLEDQLKPLPIGWPSSWPSTFWEWISKPLGLVWTGLALSLGAPFWFDTLQRFINIRGAGNKPNPVPKDPDAQAVG